MAYWILSQDICDKNKVYIFKKAFDLKQAENVNGDNVSTDDTWESCLDTRYSFF